jgi:hypothetical protein
VKTDVRDRKDAGNRLAVLLLLFVGPIFCLLAGIKKHKEAFSIPTVINYEINNQKLR